MQYRLHDISEIASKLTDLGSGIQRKLILITALPGVGKTTLAKEFQKQTNAIHFDIDEIKRAIVPQDIVTQGIDPPEYRYKYYAEAIRILPDLFAQSSTNTVIMDETFHLQAFRQMWDEAARDLNIRLHWIQAVCEEKIVKERLGTAKDRDKHILSRDKAYQIFLLFKNDFEPVQGPHEVVDTSKDIVPQVQSIVKKLSLTDCK